MKKWFPLLILSCVLTHQLISQSVVVSGYFNAADPRDEWTELLVVTDNTDMRNWTIRDNNASQTAWQTAATFTNNAFWNNMRAGTIIMVWHRPVESDGVTAHPTDINKNDGYVELNLGNATYFSGAALGSSPSWAGASMNVAGGGDVVELRDGSSTHIHALGHISTAGANWTSLALPKLNHANTASSGDAIYVSPGNVIADYGTSTPQSGTTWTAKNSGTITFGLPNISGGAPIQNTAFWDTLREPVFANQSVTPSSVIAGSPGSISFSWTGATDPNAADVTTGYIILRNTTNTFTAPADGTTYTNGASLGSATVLTHITSSATTNYTDNTVMNGNAYFYRVYAYRYTTDNTNGNTYHRSRGRAYTRTFVDIQQTNPLPVELISFIAEKNNQYVQLNWETASEINNDYFSVERANESGFFSSIGTVPGNGTSSQFHSYALTDEMPAEGINYYRLKQTDYNGQFEYSRIIAIDFAPGVQTFQTNAWISEGNLNYQISGWNSPVEILIYTSDGRLIANIQANEDSFGKIPLEGEKAGIYLIRFSSAGHTETRKLVYF